MKKRIFLYPGFVRAKDGDRHFITSVQLAELYKLNIHECYVVSPSQQRIYNHEKGDILLYPREDGKYCINWDLLGPINTDINAKPPP